MSPGWSQKGLEGLACEAGPPHGGWKSAPTKHPGFNFQDTCLPSCAKCALGGGILGRGMVLSCGPTPRYVLPP